MFTNKTASARINRKKDWWREDGDPDLTSGLHQPREFLDDIIRLVGLSDGLQEELLRSTWQQVVGNYIASGSFPDSLKKGTLTIRVTQSTLRFQLEQMKIRLLAKLQASPGGDKIQALRFTLG